MTLPTNILQSLISRNRVVLTNLHEAVVDCKEYRDEAYSNGCEDDAQAMHKFAVKYSKDIAKLAAVQRALKSELATSIAQARASRQAWASYIDFYPQKQVWTIVEVPND